jgi:short-subunit dehydrogenase
VSDGEAEPRGPAETQDTTRRTRASARRPNSDQLPSGWAIVTGASSGLGREFALALTERGHPVLAVARRGDRLRALAEEVKSRDGELEPLVADLSTAAGIDTLLTKAGELDVGLLVNNAGLVTYGSFASLSPERERELVRLNVEAIVALTRGLLPRMLARGGGGVINVASQMAFQPMPYFATYAASKAFVLSFSEALSEELRGTGVHISAVAPGFVSTEFTDVAGSHEAERHFPHLQPADVAEVALRAHAHGRTLKIAGALYAFLSIAGRFAPRFALRRAMGRILRPNSAPSSGTREGPSS